MLPRMAEVRNYGQPGDARTCEGKIPTCSRVWMPPCCLRHPVERNGVMLHDHVNRPRSVMRFLGLAGLVLTVALLAVNTAQARQDARIGGPFLADAYIVKSNYPGSKVDESVLRTYSFKPRCQKNICRAVTFKRESASSKVWKSRLRRVGKGEYQGTETSQYETATLRPECESRVLKQTAVHTVKVVKARKGRARTLRGRSEYTVPECNYFEKSIWDAEKIVKAPSGPGWHTVSSATGRGRDDLITVSFNVPVKDPPARARVKVTTKPKRMAVYGSSGIYFGPDWYVSCLSELDPLWAIRSREGSLGLDKGRSVLAPFTRKLRLPRIRNPYLCRYTVGVYMSPPKDKSRASLIRATLQVSD